MFSYFLRQLEREVLEKISLRLLIARYLRRNFRILGPVQLARTAEYPRRVCVRFGILLFRGTQRCAQITEFIVDFIGFLDSETDFFPKQLAVTNPHLVDEALHCGFGNAERF